MRCRDRSAEEVGVTNEEAFFVVVGVDEPTGDAVGSVAADFARVGMKDVDSVDLDSYSAVIVGDEIDVGFAEDKTKRLPLPCSLSRLTCGGRRSCGL